MLWLLIIPALIALLLVMASRRPDVFHIERATTINAPPERIYALLEDFHQWPAWSPWEKLDPNMQRTIAGAPRGVGATYEWSGNNKAGAGRMEITTAEPPRTLTIQLDFTRPFKASNTTAFVLTPTGQGTHLNWTMEGRNDLMAKVFTFFMNMDQMVGKDFEAGLANLKRVTES